MKNKTLLTFFVLAFGFAIFNFTSGEKVEAASCAWVGGGLDNNWSNAANWDGGCAGVGGIPDNGDSTQIPANADTNNDIVGLSINSFHFTGTVGGGTNTGNDLRLTGAVTSEDAPAIIDIFLIIDGAISMSSNDYIGGIDVNGGIIEISPTLGDLEITSNITGSGTLNVSYMADELHLIGGGIGFSGNINVTASTLMLDGPGWDIDTTVNLTLDGTFTGKGAGVTQVTTDGTSTISPSRLGVGSTELMSIDTLSLNSGSTIELLLGGTTIGTNYDSIHTVGALDISGVTLSLNLDSGYSAPAGDSFTILESSAGITGEFNGAPDGSIITAGGRPFQISYLGTVVTLSVPSIGLSNPIFTSDPAIPAANQPFTITSFWLGLGPTATGTAELFNGSTSLGTASLVSGVATFNITGLPQGDYSLTVEYSGDINFSARTSGPLDLTVTAALADTGINLPLHLIVLSLLLSLGSFILIKRNLK